MADADQNQNPNPNERVGHDPMSVPEGAETENRFPDTTKQGKEVFIEREGEVKGAEGHIGTGEYDEKSRADDRHVDETSKGEMKSMPPQDEQQSDS